MRTVSTRTKILATAVVVLSASATAAYAISPEPDAVNLRTPFASGGEAWLELEDRNVEPAICFIWTNPLPQDGDSVASRILTVGGAMVVDLGTGDQWISGSTSACEIPRDGRYRDVFANPGRYIVEFVVTENQGTPVTGPVRSLPLKAAPQ